VLMPCAVAFSAARSTENPSAIASPFPASRHIGNHGPGPGAVHARRAGADFHIE
jgi:hypothetical protein